MPSQVSIQSWVCHANTASPLVFSIGESDGTPLQYSCLENPWTEEPGRLHAVHGVVKSRTRLSDFTFTFHFHALEKEMATHSSVLAWRIPGTGEPWWLPSMGSHRVGHDWSDAAAAAAVFSIPQNYLKLTYNLSKKNVLPVKTFLVINPLPSLPTRLLLLSPWSSEILEPATESYLLSLRYFGVLLLWLAPLSS